MAAQGPLVPTETNTAPPSTAGVGFAVGQTSRSGAARGLAALQGAMQTPEEVLVMRQLQERGWSRRPIAAAMAVISD